jgi:hypothetical protein
MATGTLGIIEGQKDLKASQGTWMFDEEDWTLIAMLTDPVFMAELLFDEPKNHDHAGCYTVYAHQYPLFRPTANYQTWPTARGVGKTESLKARAISHGFKRIGEDLLLTAPELIHLKPLTDAIESRITSTRLTNDFLKKENQRTGIVKTPAFQVDFVDSTRIMARIPRSTGQGVKGMHEPDMLMDESQDYPPRGFTEIHETVMKEHTDRSGELDFSYHLYGVQSAGQGGSFATLVASGDYTVTTITALMRPKWSKQEKAAAAALYGGTNSPDYRRNILGEPGTGSSQFFVTARLIACLDQNEESKYNTVEYVKQQLQIEEIDQKIPQGGDVGTLLDLPEGLGQEVYCGMDVGLVNDPTVIMIFAVLPDTHKKPRLKLVRKIHLWRFREGQIRQCTYAIALKYGKTLRAFGQDITGLGLPLYQAMEDAKECPEHLREVARGYVFNAVMPIAVNPEYVSDRGGEMVDQYGHMVEKRHNDWTGQDELVAKMSMIEASTRFLRQFVDDGFLWLPFDNDLVKDLQGETEQRVQAMGSVQLRKKPNAFHELDAMRAMAMAYKAEQLEEMVYQHSPGAVLDQTIDLKGQGRGETGGFELGPGEVPLW